MLFKNLIDSETGKNIVIYKTGDFDRKKFRKERRKEQQATKKFVKRLLNAYKND